ncbi:uncharacterized protein BKA55DRAFT_668931 [Fusarium redolens]|uniref:Mid2 domain-containing protein n=1 Tax=Fusarium redolens TaxID=48865 RepID=A0A9P9FV85_FUSRE|nr:uncharacterized protein BKA55DRAFT_668931 [Fusarium redolens]KAH7203106.1 hypothetical protein BKA55DRAFT_668931 [Fusarium redolens]
MSFLEKVGLVFSLLASQASCDSKFNRPPEWDPEQEADQDSTKNIRYDDGETIPILFDTDLAVVDLYISQVGFYGKGSRYGLLSKNGPPYPDGWVAEYDAGKMMKNNEDCVYWFGLYESGHRVAASQYVNVSAPKLDKTKTITATKTLSFLSETFTTRTSAESTTKHTADTTGASLSDETSSASSDSRLSKGGTAGVAVGATLGGLLILGGIGWIVWRRLAKRKNNTVPPAELPDHSQQQPYASEQKIELPGHPEAYPPHHARSPSQIFEAP